MQTYEKTVPIKPMVVVEPATGITLDVSIWFTTSTCIRQGQELTNPLLSDVISQFSHIEAVDLSVDLEISWLLSTAPNRPQTVAQERTDVALIYELIATISSRLIQN